MDLQRKELERIENECKAKEQEEEACPLREEEEEEQRLVDVALKRRDEE